MGFAVKSLTFLDEGVQFEFVEVPDDLRENGMLLNRALYVPEQVMPDQLQGLMDKAIAVVSEAMYLHQKSDPVDPEAMDRIAHGEWDDEPEDETPSPWDNPEERDVPDPDAVFEERRSDGVEYP